MQLTEIYSPISYIKATIKKTRVAIKVFRLAIKAYNHKDYITALNLLNRYQRILKTI